MKVSQPQILALRAPSELWRRNARRSTTRLSAMRRREFATKGLRHAGMNPDGRFVGTGGLSVRERRLYENYYENY